MVRHDLLYDVEITAWTRLWANVLKGGESITCFFFNFPARDLLLPLTPNRMDQQLLLSLPKDTGKMG